MASRKQRKRKRESARLHSVSARVPQIPEPKTRPSPVQAIAEKHVELAQMLSARTDRFSQILAKGVNDEFRGQYLASTSNLSAEDGAELATLSPAAHSSFRAELSAAIDELRTLLQGADPLYIATIIQLSNLMTGWGTYFEPTHRGGEHNVELVAGLLVTQPASASPDRPSDSAMQRIHDLLEEIRHLLLLFNLSAPRDDDPTVAELRFVGAMRWMLLRGSSYHHHGQDLARAVYGPHDPWLIERYGFAIDDVLTVGQTVDRLTMSRVNALAPQAVEFSEGIIEDLRRQKARGELPPKVAEQLGPEEERTIQLAAMFDYFGRHVRDAATFSLAELCDFNPALIETRAAAVLGEMSISVGSLDRSSYSGLFDESPLVERPFLEFDGGYLLAVQGMVLRDPLQLLEDRIQAKPNFSKARAKTLDELAIRYLSSMLPGSASYTNLCYLDAELDGLVIFDSTAFVVECKGTQLSVQANRGDITRLVRDINRAVQEAWEQGARARDFILGTTDAIFTDEDGNEVLRLQPGEISEVCIVNPTLHELGGHGPELARLQALGLFPEGEFPWSVFINDLRVISETCDNAAVFLHYLVWRARLPLGAQIRVSDEIDLWGSYLLCEQFEALAGTDTFTMMSIGNASTDFDAYYAGVLGEGPEARRPAKFLREPAKSFVERMAAERPAGWRDAAGACLDMSIPEQAFVAAMAKEAAQLAAREGLATWREVGRVALVGLPRGLDVVAVAAQFTPDSDEVTLVVYCRATRTNRTEIIWAGYARPLTLPSRSVGEKPAA